MGVEGLQREHKARLPDCNFWKEQKAKNVGRKILRLKYFGMLAYSRQFQMFLQLVIAMGFTLSSSRG